MKNGARTIPCIACAEEILPNAKLCKHCGTMQNDERFKPAAVTGLAVPSQHLCLVCGASVESHQRVCDDCDLTCQAPRNCPACNAEIKSRKLKQDQISAVAGRIRQCPTCKYYFFLPSSLAAVINSKVPGRFDSIDIEYLFFASWGYQFSNFGGSYPSIECDYEIARPLYDDWLENDGDGDFSGSWVAAWFPIVEQDEFFRLLKKYQEFPQLFSQSNFNIEDDDEVFDIELLSYLPIPELNDADLRLALIQSLSMSTGDPSVIQATVKFLNSDDAFEAF